MEELLKNFLAPPFNAMTRHQYIKKKNIQYISLVFLFSWHQTTLVQLEHFWWESFVKMVDKYCIYVNMFFQAESSQLCGGVSQITDMLTVLSI